MRKQSFPAQISDRSGGAGPAGRSRPRRRNPGRDPSQFPGRHRPSRFASPSRIPSRCRMSESFPPHRSSTFAPAVPSPSLNPCPSRFPAPIRALSLSKSIPVRVTSQSLSESRLNPCPSHFPGGGSCPAPPAPRPGSLSESLSCPSH